MKSSKNKPSFVHTGTSMLMVVFIIIVLITFSAAILISADNDSSLTEKLAENKTEYYAASNLGEEVLADIDDVLEAAYQNSSDTDGYFMAANENLAKLTYDFTSLELTGDDRLFYSIEISEERELQIELQICIPDDNEGSYYRILQWRSVSTRQWNGDDSLNVYVPGN